jgi:hypothetical protein
MFIIPKNYVIQPDSNLYHHIGTISWYIVFIVLIPFLIVRIKGFNALKYYLPVVDLIANIFSVSGPKNNRLFKDLYSLSPSNIIAFVSTNFINLLALTGVAWNGIYIAMKNKNMMEGIIVAIIMYTITYLIPTQGIPFMVSHLQERIDKKLGINYDKDKRDIYGYLGGFTFLIAMYSIETAIITAYITYMES